MTASERAMAHEEWARIEALEDRVTILEALIGDLRAGISWARGMCSDGRPVEEIDHFLGCVLAGHAQLPPASDEEGSASA